MIKYSITIKAMMQIRISVSIVLISVKIRNACAKVAISKQPIIAPSDIAKNVFHGFIPIKRPTIEPTKPPDP